VSEDTELKMYEKGDLDWAGSPLSTLPVGSLKELKQRWVDVLSPVASRFNLTFMAFGSEITASSAVSSGLLKLTDAYNTGLEPAPVSPTFNDPTWDVLAGTIRASLTSSSKRRPRPLPVYVAPGLSLGNTDTRHYWNLTKHIFRYGHLGQGDANNGAHTINEAVRGEGFIEMIRFHTRLIVNMDEADLP